MLLRLLRLGKDLLPTLPRRRAAVALEAAECPWPALRSQPSDADAELTPQTQAWLARLPAHAHPKRLCECHPRVVNRLACGWGDGSAFSESIDSLLVDDRGGRTGFTPAIRSELVRLQFLHRKLMVDADPTERRQALANPLKAQPPAIDSEPTGARHSRV